MNNPLIGGIGDRTPFTRPVAAHQSAPGTATHTGGLTTFGSQRTSGTPFEPHSSTLPAFAETPPVSPQQGNLNAISLAATGVELPDVSISDNRLALENALNAASYAESRQEYATLKLQASQEAVNAAEAAVTSAQAEVDQLNAEHSDYTAANPVATDTTEDEDAALQQIITRLQDAESRLVGANEALAGARADVDIAQADLATAGADADAAQQRITEAQDALQTAIDEFAIYHVNVGFVGLINSITTQMGNANDLITGSLFPDQ